MTDAVASPPARSRSVAIALAGAAALGLGCPGDSADTAVVEIGTGTIAFEPLAADQELVLIAGPQGGHHFIVHARAQGIAPGRPSLPGHIDNPSTRFEAYAADESRLDLTLPPYRLGYVPGEASWYELPSGRILQVDETRVAGLYGEPVRLVVRITDADGAAGSDERWVRAVMDPAPPDDDGGLPPPDAGLADGGVDAGPTDAGL